METGGGPGGSTWLRSRSPHPLLNASGALTRAGAAEWTGLAVTACVRLLGKQEITKRNILGSDSRISLRILS